MAQTQRQFGMAAGGAAGNATKFIAACAGAACARSIKCFQFILMKPFFIRECPRLERESNYFFLSIEKGTLHGIFVYLAHFFNKQSCPYVINNVFNIPIVLKLIFGESK